MRRDQPAAARFALAGGMAFLAGATDVHGLARLHDLFVSFMSGNSTMLGVAIGRGDFDRAGRIATVLLLFVGGAAIGSALAIISRQYHTAAVAVAVTLLLAAPLLLPQATVPLLVISMGVLNAAMHHAGATGVSLTYVTGALVKFGQGVGSWICGRREDWSWLLQALLWVCLICGAILASVIESRSEADVAWSLPVLSALLTFAATLQLALYGADSD